MLRSVKKQCMLYRPKGNTGTQSKSKLLSVYRLSGCMVTEFGCGYLASALRSATSHLDLSYNHPGDSGVKLLTERLNDPNCMMEKLKYVKHYI